MAKRSSKSSQQMPPGKEEGNSYDKIFKENLRELAPGLISAVLKYTNYQLTLLPKVKMQTTLEKDPDFLMLITDQHSPGSRILHLEFEGKDETVMDWRMAEYLGIGGKIHRKEMEQHVFYLGEGKPKNITGRIKHTHFDYCYPVHCISRISKNVFLYADTPEEVVFAILANPEGMSSDEIVSLILERLVLLAGDSIAIRKFIKQLVMLSKKRNLQNITIHKASEMIGYQDYEDDILYIQGLQKGEEEGLEKGLEEGKEEKDIIAIRNMLKKGFDHPAIAELLEVTTQYVQGVQKQLEKEPEIAALLKKKNAGADEIAKQLSVRPALVRVVKQHLKQ